MQLDELRIDKEFHDLIPMLSSEEYNMLESNILEENKVRDPIVVWRNENIIVDGHNRYSILQKHPGIPYSVLEKDFDSRDEVILWICRNQIGRRNLSDIQMTIIQGTAYETQKRIDYAKELARSERGQFVRMESSQRTRDKIANDYGVSDSHIERSGRFVRGLNEIEKEVPGTTERIKRGELEVTKKDVMALTSMDDEEDKQKAIKAIVEGRRIEPITKAPEIAEPYNVNDFRSELHRKAETLDKSLELTCCMVHPEMLETEEGREALNDALLEITEVVKKYMAYC